MNENVECRERTEEEFEAYLKTLGRLRASEPFAKRRVTLFPGRSSDGKPVNESERHLYPERLIGLIFPSPVPRALLPRLFEPAFDWLHRGPHRSVVRDLLLNSTIEYDEIDHKHSDPVNALWTRFHVAYLVNEIAPDSMITLRLSDGATLEKLKGDERLDHLLGEWADTRDIKASDWLKELMPLARIYYSFLVNGQNLGRDLFACCEPANSQVFAALMNPHCARVLRSKIYVSGKDPYLFHPSCLQTVLELAASTPEQRMEAFDQMISIGSIKDFRPTFGDRLVNGKRFSAGNACITRHYQFEFVAALIGRGFLAADTDRRTLEITEGGWKVVETLRSLPNVDDYQDIIIEMTASNVALDDTKGLEDWSSEFFSKMKEILG